MHVKLQKMRYHTNKKNADLFIQKFAIYCCLLYIFNLNDKGKLRPIQHIILSKYDLNEEDSLFENESITNVQWVKIPRKFQPL